MLDDRGVSVRVVAVAHGRADPAFADWFDTADRQVMFSGGTTVNDDLIALAPRPTSWCTTWRTSATWSGTALAGAALDRMAGLHTDVTEVGGVGRAGRGGRADPQPLPARPNPARSAKRTGPGGPGRGLRRAHHRRPGRAAPDAARPAGTVMAVAARTCSPAMGVLVRWVDTATSGSPASPRRKAGPARRTVPAETTQAPDQQRRTPRRAAGNGPPRRQRFVLAPARHPRRQRSGEFPTGPLPTSSQVRSSSSRPAPERLLGRDMDSKQASLADRQAVPGAGQQRIAARGAAVSGGVGFEPDGAEVVAGGEADVGVEGGGEAAQQGDGGLGAAFLDALDIVLGEGGPQGQFGDGQAEGGADVVQGLAEGQGLADREPLGIISRVLRGAPSGCGSWSSHTCLSQACVAGPRWSRSQVFSAHGQRGRS